MDEVTTELVRLLTEARKLMEIAHTLDVGDTIPTEDRLKIEDLTNSIDDHAFLIRTGVGGEP